MTKTLYLLAGAVQEQHIGRTPNLQNTTVPTITDLARSRSFCGVPRMDSHGCWRKLTQDPVTAGQVPEGKLEAVKFHKPATARHAAPCD